MINTNNNPRASFEEQERTRRNSVAIAAAQAASTSSHAPSATFCTKSIDETLIELRTSATDGIIPAQDATYRRSIHGLNELKSEEAESIIIKFIKKFYEDPLIILLIVSAAISFCMGNTEDAISIGLAILIVITVGFVQEYRSEKSLEALNSLVPAEAHLTRGGHTQTVMASSLVPGDLVHFGVGDRIPADIRLIEAIHLTIDESNLTGENKPARKSTDPVKIESSLLNSPFSTGIPVNEQQSIAFMGTLVRNGRGSGIVIATGPNTAFGTVFEIMSSIDKPKTPLQLSMDQLGKHLSLMSFAVIGVICLFGIFEGRSWLDMFTISVSLAVAAIPEGLPIIVTVTLALGVLRMAKKKAIVRRLPSVETLGSVNVICSDKTGTLTKNMMTVTKLWSYDMGVGNFVNSELDNLFTSNESLPKNNLAIAKLFEIGNICNSSIFSSESNKYIGNPTDVALIDVLSKFTLQDIRATKVKTIEIPFSSSRKWMAVSAHNGSKSTIVTYVKGAVERILELSTSYMTITGATLPLNDKIKSQIIENANKMSEDGSRILAFATANGSIISSSSNIDLEDEKNDDILPKNIVFTGLTGMYDPPRPNVKNSIMQLMRGRVRVIMITGDSESTALNIAKSIGIPVQNKHSVMSGDDLNKLTPEALADAIQYVSVFARTTPKHKMAIVEALQLRGDVVAMTGDGVNDAPALKLADIGISMGKNGTDVAKEAADMVLTDDDFSTILTAIEEGKAIFYNIQNFLTFQLSTSIAALSLIALSTFFRLPTPLNAMQILWINILMDGPPAQSLGVEPVDHAIMNKPPRSRKDQILTKSVFKRIIQAATIIVSGTCFIYISEMAKDGEVTKRDTTMTFTCFVFFDMFNALSCRSATKSVFENGFFTNVMFNAAVGLSILGQFLVIYLPFFQRIFQTEALGLNDILFLFCLCSTVWIADEISKFFKKRKNGRRGGVLSGFSLPV